MQKCGEKEKQEERMKERKNKGKAHHDDDDGDDDDDDEEEDDDDDDDDDTLLSDKSDFLSGSIYNTKLEQNTKVHTFNLTLRSQNTIVPSAYI